MERKGTEGNIVEQKGTRREQKRIEENRKEHKETRRERSRTEENESLSAAGCGRMKANRLVESTDNHQDG